MSRGRCRIGTSGYQYDHWRGVFYPGDLDKDQWLGHYADRFDTVEINSTFYGLPKPETVRRWRQAAGDDFCFAVKFSRYNDAGGCAVADARDLSRYVANAASMAR